MEVLKQTNQDTAVNLVYTTKNYGMFKNLVGNRSIHVAHMKRLVVSFEQQYLLSPILVNEKFEVIDGQHRLMAAKELNLPVYYIMVEGYGLKEVQRLNTNMSNWKKVDYLDAFCDMGIEDYLKFRQFWKEFPEFTLECIEIILGNGTVKMTQKSFKENNRKRIFRQKDFAEGKFKVYDYDLAVANANKILQIKPYYSGYTRKIFVSAMIGLLNNRKYDHDRFIHKLQKNRVAMVDCIRVQDYKEVIETIYNHGSKYKVNLRFDELS